VGGWRSACPLLAFAHHRVAQGGDAGDLDVGPVAVLDVFGSAFGDPILTTSPGQRVKYRLRWEHAGENEFKVSSDSPLEEDGFEPSVPLAELSRGTKGSNPSLSRRTICLTIEFPGYGGKPPDIRMALAVALRAQRCGRSEDRSLLCWRNRRAGRGPACRKTRIAGLMYPPQVCHEAPGMALNLTVLAGSGTR